MQALSQQRAGLQAVASVAQPAASVAQPAVLLPAQLEQVIWHGPHKRWPGQRHQRFLPLWYV